ncbi:hypothetical protein BDW62DRAFT_217515 [Aspergillus aurantiobrunneus]
MTRNPRNRQLDNDEQQDRPTSIQTLEGIKGGDITFIEELSSSDYSAGFLGHIENKPYFFKAHRGQGPKEPWDDQRRDTNIHTGEVRAYQRMQEHGRCDRGVVPRFYGSIEEIDPQLYAPHLDDFLRDEYLPSAILLEYIPNMMPLHWKNYTKGRADTLLKEIREIQAAGIEHCDVYPRNMMVFEDDANPNRDRAIWIDFDRSQTYDMDRLTQLQREWLDIEMWIAVRIMADMKADSENGEMHATIILYN